MSDDIVTRLREPCSWVESTHTRFGLDQERAEAADEIERLRAERYEWFIVARQLKDALHVAQEIEEAVNEYLRVRGRLEDPRDSMPEVTDV